MANGLEWIRTEEEVSKTVQGDKDRGVYVRR